MRMPPLLPEVTLARVLRLARFDGTVLLAIAGTCALLAAAAADTVGAVIGLLVAGAGALELHGVGLLRQGSARGLSRLVTSQLLLLGTILGYCAFRMVHAELPPVPDRFAVLIDTAAQQLKMSRGDYLRFVQRIGLQMVAVASLLYQGGMALYYLRRRADVIRALEDEAPAGGP